jgi:AcrR family transcriptional regulator
MIDGFRSDDYDAQVVASQIDTGSHSSRQRLLEAAKALFAKSGFEQTPTAAIAREAGTSESQLVRYFHNKAGLLEAIFNESWDALNHAVQQVVMAAANAREALVGVLETISAAFVRDPDLAQLFLFEGRRIRGGTSEVILSKGFIEFDKLLCILIKRGKKDGTFRDDITDQAIASALLGATEAMIRDRLIAMRAAKEEPFTNADVRAIFAAMLSGLAPATPA